MSSKNEKLKRLLALKKQRLELERDVREEAAEEDIAADELGPDPEEKSQSSVSDPEKAQRQVNPFVSIEGMHTADVITLYSDDPEALSIKDRLRVEKHLESQRNLERGPWSWMA